MNRNSHNFAKREGWVAKHLPISDEKPKQINAADVAELVDARDLKSPAPIDRATFSFKICEFAPANSVSKPARLQNSFAPDRSGGRA